VLLLRLAPNEVFFASSGVGVVVDCEFWVNNPVLPVLELVVFVVGNRPAVGVVCGVGGWLFENRPFGLFYSVLAPNIGVLTGWVVA